MDSLTHVSVFLHVPQASSRSLLMSSNLSHQRRAQGCLHESMMGSSINLALEAEGGVGSSSAGSLGSRPSTSTLYSQFQSTESENR